MLTKNHHIARTPEIKQYLLHLPFFFCQFSQVIEYQAIQSFSQSFKISFFNDNS